MKRLTLSALIALSLCVAACDRREVEPVEPAATAGAAAVDAPAAIMPGAEPVPPPMSGGACEGLVGQALTDCIERAGPTTDPALADPTLTDPTAPTTNDAGIPTDTDAGRQMPEPADTPTPQS